MSASWRLTRKLLRCFAASLMGVVDVEKMMAERSDFYSLYLAVDFDVVAAAGPLGVSALLLLVKLLVKFRF